MTQAEAPLLVLEDIEVVYGKGAACAQALSDVSLTLHDGEAIALTGPSGSGKTSLLQVMGLLITPTRGRVLLRGEVADAGNAAEAGRLRRESYGFVFQAYNLFPTLTAIENVQLAFSIKKVGRERTQAAALLDVVGLGDLTNRFPAQLSGGQKQRVAIARALAGEPAIILADEPTAALDSESGEKIMSLLGGLASPRRSVVIVSHDPRVTSHVGRAVALRDGRLSRSSRPGSARTATAIEG